MVVQTTTDVVRSSSTFTPSYNITIGGPLVSTVPTGGYSSTLSVTTPVSPTPTQPISGVSGGITLTGGFTYGGTGGVSGPSITEPSAPTPTTPSIPIAPITMSPTSSFVSTTPSPLPPSPSSILQASTPIYVPPFIPFGTPYTSELLTETMATGKFKKVSEAQEYLMSKGFVNPFQAALIARGTPLGGYKAGALEKATTPQTTEDVSKLVGLKQPNMTSLVVPFGARSISEGGIVIGYEDVARQQSVLLKPLTAITPDLTSRIVTPSEAMQLALLEAKEHPDRKSVV